MGVKVNSVAVRPPTQIVLTVPKRTGEECHNSADTVASFRNPILKLTLDARGLYDLLQHHFGRPCLQLSTQWTVTQCSSCKPSLCCPRLLHDFGALIRRRYLRPLIIAERLRTKTPGNDQVRRSEYVGSGICFCHHCRAEPHSIRMHIWRISPLPTSHISRPGG